MTHTWWPHKYKSGKSEWYNGRNLEILLLPILFYFPFNLIIDKGYWINLTLNWFVNDVTKCHSQILGSNQIVRWSLDIIKYKKVRNKLQWKKKQNQLYSRTHLKTTYRLSITHDVEFLISSQIRTNAVSASFNLLCKCSYWINKSEFKQ